MENKYYTPEIEELRVGFEYEEDVHGNNKWNKKIIKPTNITQVCKDLLDDIRLSEENEYTFRVKYLTKEDIEECEKKLENYSLNIEYLFSEKYCWIKKSGSISFSGKIKNKSELKQILKMIL